jgi:uncharacterized damage-inducible protein DinB
MHKSEIVELYDYTYWANHRLLNVLDGLPPTNLERTLLPGAPCLLDILAHGLGAEIVWWTRLAEGVSPLAIPGRAQFPGLAEIARRWQLQETHMRAFLASLSETDLSANCSYTTTKGKIYVTPRSQLLLHLVNHETQHRAEAALLATALGRSPGDLDFIVYLRQQV